MRRGARAAARDTKRKRGISLGRRSGKRVVGEWHGWRKWENRSGLFSQSVQTGDFAVDEAAVPEALVEVPLETGEAVEEAEFEEVADAEVGEGKEVTRQFVVLRLTRIGPDAQLHARDSLLCLTLCIAISLLFCILQGEPSVIGNKMFIPNWDRLKAPIAFILWRIILLIWLCIIDIRIPIFLKPS